MKHVLLYQQGLQGWQYGVHKALEDEIVRQTNAEVVTVPEHQFEKNNRRVEHGRRLGFIRDFLPKMNMEVDADVAWHVLMAPGDYNLDLVKNWYRNVKYRIVYVFDTLQPIEKALIDAFSDDTFNIHITSFNDAVPYMERITGKKWHSIEQAAPESLFECLPNEQRVIPFASYGRRFPAFHKTLLEFVKENNLYYDFSTYNGTVNIEFDPYMYNHYAWHVSHSVYNICWPVELTDPRRAGTFNPITCRWFEAAAAGTCIVGKKPANDYFNTCLHPDLVVEIDPFKKRAELLRDLERIWQNRDAHLNMARQIRNDNIHRWTWKDRVERMLRLINE
jgi:hypothetical protein